MEAELTELSEMDSKTDNLAVTEEETVDEGIFLSFGLASKVPNLTHYGMV